MLIDTVRFGQIEVDDSKIVKFQDGLPGFEQLTKFILLSPEQTQPLYWMQSMEDGDVALPVISSFDILDDYTLDIPDEVVAGLEMEGLEDLLVMNVCVVPDDVSQMTANLAAPILMNVRLNIGIQIVVDSKEYPTRYSVFADVCRAAKGGEADAGVDQKDR